MGVVHALYTVQLSDKYENLLKELFWNDSYLIFGMGNQYVGNWNNNAKKISSVSMHVRIVDMHTLYPWPY